MSIWVFACEKILQTGKVGADETNICFGNEESISNNEFHQPPYSSGLNATMFHTIRASLTTECIPWLILLLFLPKREARSSQMSYLTLTLGEVRLCKLNY